MESPWRRVEREWRRTGNGAAKIWFSSPWRSRPTTSPRSPAPAIRKSNLPMRSSPSRRSASSSATPLPARHPAVTASALMFAYFMIVLRLPFVPNQPDGWFFTASKIAIARLVSIGLTVWLMQHYTVFRRLPGGSPRYFGYVVCGVIAAAASAGVCQIFRLGDVHALSGLIEIARADLPLIALSGLLCAALSFCCDNWAGDTVAPIWLRFVGAVGCGLVMAVSMAFMYFATCISRRTCFRRGCRRWYSGYRPYWVSLSVAGCRTSSVLLTAPLCRSVATLTTFL